MGRGLLIAATAMAAATFGTGAYAGDAGAEGGSICGFSQGQVQSVMKTLSPAEHPAETVAAAPAPAPAEPAEDIEALVSSLLKRPFKLPETAEQDG